MQQKHCSILWQANEPQSEHNPVWTGPVFEANSYMMKAWHKKVKYSSGQSDEKFYVSDLSDDQFELNKQAAIYWHSAGIPFNNSTGICDTPTRGYGRLDWHGYFEYPLL